jgi:hypothetical protein
VFLLSNGDWLYTPTCSKLFRVDATASPGQAAPEIIATNLKNIAGTGNQTATLSGSKVYFLATCSQVQKSCLFESPLNGNEQTSPTELSAISGDFIYPAASPSGDLLLLVNNGQTGQPSYKPSSSSNPTPFSQACEGECVHPFLSSSHLYWESSANGKSVAYKAQRTNLAVQDLAVEQLFPYTLVVDDLNTLYYVGPKDGTSYPLIRKKKDGTKEKLAQIDNPGMSVAVVDGFLYMLSPSSPAQVLRVQVKD